MDVLLRRTLTRTRPAAVAWLLWAIGLALALSAPHGCYQASVWSWLELVVPGTYLAWVAAAWIHLGRGRALEEVELVADPRWWVVPVLARGLGLWAVLALAEWVMGSPDPRWLLFTPLMLSLISGVGMVLAQEYLPVLPSLALALLPMATADWRATLPSLAILGLVLARRRRWRGSTPTALGLVALGSLLQGCGLWMPLLICLPLLGAEASFRTAEAVIKVRRNGFWADISTTPLGQELFCRRVSLGTALALLPASAALAALFSLSLLHNPQSSISCGMWTSCLCSAVHPERDEWAGYLAWLASAVALVVPLAANRLGLLVGALARGRSQALLLIALMGLGLLALSGASLLPQLFLSEGEAGRFYHDWLMRMLGLSVLTALLSDWMRVRFRGALNLQGPLPWLPVWLCLAHTSHFIYRFCAEMSLVMGAQDVVFIILWTSAAAQGLVGTLVYLCLEPRNTALVAVYGVLAGVWAEKCPVLESLEVAPAPSYLPALGLVLALLCQFCNRLPEVGRR